MNDAISKLRNEIDLVTAEIVSLLKKRFELLDDVLKQKVQMGRELQDPQREIEIISNVQKQLGEHAAAPNITKVIKSILFESLQYMGQKNERK
jgi:chorismate mutase